MAPASPIRKLTPYADAAKARGITVYHLNIGQPDFSSPRAIMDAISGFGDSVLAYAPSQGLPAARQAWSDYYAAQGLDVPVDQILVTTGGSEAISFAIAAVADPGDNVLVFEPTYTNYCGFAAAASVSLRAVALDPDHGYAIPSPETVAGAIDDRTRAILLCNPNNPTGSVYDRRTMKAYLALAESMGLFLIVDEAYREFLYDRSIDYANVLAIGPRSQHLIMVDSTSKRFNVCGARVGCLVSPNPAIVDAALRFAQARLSVATVEQLAVVPLLRDPLPYTTQLVADYLKRRDVVLRLVRALPGAGYSEPQGAFYMVVKLPVDDSESFARWMLETFSHNGETVFVAPMAGFYVSAGKGTDEVRLAFVLEEGRLARAVELLHLGLAGYLSR